jgi:hypothetical protein
MNWGHQLMLPLSHGESSLKMAGCVICHLSLTRRIILNNFDPNLINIKHNFFHFYKLAEHNEFYKLLKSRCVDMVCNILE